MNNVQDLILEVSENGHTLIKRDKKYFLQTNCEICKKLFERQITLKIFNANKHKLFCCGRDCRNESQRSGNIKKVKEKHFLDKYGVINPYLIPKVREQVKRTNIERYGVDNISKLDSIKQSKSQKMKDICENTDFRERVENTTFERYGNKCFWGSEQSRELLRDYSLINYGVEHYTQSEKFQDEMREHYLETIGVENPMQLESTKEKIRNTCLERYEVDNVFKRPDVIQNRMNSIAENAKNLTSKAEIKIFEILKEHFEEVVTQKYVKYGFGKHTFWLIDFHLVKEDVYIQYDGVYWHGIGKDIEELKLKETKSSQMQLGAIEKDLKQNIWFKENNKMLFRIIEGTSTEKWLSELKAIINNNGNFSSND